MTEPILIALRAKQLHPVDFMKILLVIRSLHTGGAERQFLATVRALQKRDHQTHACLLEASGRLLEELFQLGVPVHSLGHGNRWSVIRTGLRLRRLCHVVNPTIVYSSLTVANLLCAVFLSRKFRRSLAWGVRMSGLDMSVYSFFARAVAWLERVLAKVPKVVIANSEAGRKHCLLVGFPKDRLEVVPNIIDTCRFRIDQSAREDVRCKHGVAPGTRIVLVPARLDPIKGHPDLLAAAALVVPLVGPIEFWFVGGGEPDFEAEYRRLANSLGIANAVRWLGVVTNMQGYYNAADLVVLPSHSEGFPNVIGEAMACGAKVVATNVGDTASIVGDPCSLVPPQQPAKLAEAIVRSLEAETSSPQARRAIIEQQYSETKVVHLLECILSRVASAQQ